MSIADTKQYINFLYEPKQQRTIRLLGKEPTNMRSYLNVNKTTAMAFLTDPSFYKGRHAYISVSPSNATNYNIVWVDMDTLDTSTLTGLPEPSMVVHTGGGRHYYWKLDRFVEAARVEAINYNLALQMYGDHCYDVNRLLRVAGTQNIKYNTPAGDYAPVKTEYYSNTTYAPSRFSTNAIVPKNTESIVDFELSPIEELEKKLRRLPANALERVMSGHSDGEDWSYQDFTICWVLKGYGFTPADIFSLFTFEEYGLARGVESRGRDIKRYVTKILVKQGF